MLTYVDIQSEFVEGNTPECQVLGIKRIVLLLVWGLSSFGTCFFARDLQAGGPGQPWAYAIAGQGLLILFIALVIVNAVLFKDDEKSEVMPTDQATAGG